MAGSESYANFADQLLSWEECELLIGAYCAEAGLPAGAAEATGALRAQLEDTAARVDTGYPHNTDLVIDEGLLVLQAPPRPGAPRLGAGPGGGTDRAAARTRHRLPVTIEP